MINKNINCFILFLLFAHSVFSQQSVYHTSLNGNYTKGMEYYEKGNYATAQEFFEKVSVSDLTDQNSEIVARSAYMTAMCAVKLFHEDAEYLVNLFVGRYPGHTLANNATFQLANYFYALKKYKPAIDYYGMVNKNDLTKEEQAEYLFKKGYCLFMQDDTEGALTAFYEIKDKDTKYTSPALYYYSHINYSQKNYQTALEGFLKLTGDETFGAIVPYYVTQIYFLQEKYDKIIEYAPPLLENVTEKRAPEVARIIGESYFHTNRFEASIPYLEKYMETASYVTKEDKYQLAYAYYKSGKYEEAAEMFGRLSSGNSLLCQNALYHMADCYLKLDRKQDARMSFASAAKLSFDKKISEDALFNYAVLTYELTYTPFNDAIVALNQYIEKYPSSKRTDEAYNYLVMAYMTTKNYRMALNSLEKISDKTPEIRKAWQKIAYNRALELFNNLKFRESIAMFDESLKYGSYDNTLKILTGYWKAEAYYRLSDYPQAIANYQSFINQAGAYRLNEYALAQYGLGYACFQQKQYNEASSWFRKYVATMNNTVERTVGDALNRTGDCFFVQKDYYSAIDFYDKSITNGSSDVDYALFQKGISQGVLDKEDQKIEAMKKLIGSYPSSNYVDDALYELGESYVSLNNPDEALIQYKKIIDNYPQSSYVPKALVNLGLIHYNANRLQDAMAAYKKVIQDYPGTSEARGALSGLKNVFVDMNNVDGYFSYVKSLGSFAQVSDREQDSLSYISAENTYMSGDCEKSSQSFKRYIENHPNGSFILNAHFYKGDCNYQQKQYDEALVSFEYIIGKPRNVFTEQALLGASRITYSQQKYAQALDYYKQLETVTETKGNLLESRIGQMRCLYLLEDYDKAIDAARKVLASEKVPDAVTREAEFKLAKSLYAKDRLALALEEFKKTATEVNSSEGAESKFRVAEIYFKRDELKEADNTISEFAEMTTPHQYWMAKSFILWADVLIAQGNNFQAIQTLQSIIDYYENSNDGIIELAKQKHKELVDKQQADEKYVKPEDIEINVP